MNIMLVDDNTQFRSFLKSMLLKYVPDLNDIIECGNGRESLDNYLQFSVDWVLMDIEMPVMNGFTALEKILDAHSTANIIIMTQYNDEEYAQKALSKGAKAFFTKDNVAHIIEKLKSKPQNN